MLLSMRVPGERLKPWIEVLWYAQAPAQSYARERLLPSGTAELIVNLREDETRIYDADTGIAVDRHPAALLCGPHGRPFAIDTDIPIRIYGVHFRGGGAWPFFGIPLGELTDRHVALGDLWTEAAARELRGRLAAVADPGIGLAFLEQYLERRLDRSPVSRHPAVAALLGALAADPAVVRIGTVAEQAGLSENRLRTLFERQVGLTPKRFARVRRFQRVLTDIEHQPSVDWSAVAADGGYFDQSHLIQEFRRFTTLTPSAYLERRTRHVSHIRFEPSNAE